MIFNIATRIHGALLTDPKGTVPIFHKHFLRGLTESTLLLQAETVARTPVSSGFLRRSIGSEVRGENIDMMGIVGSPLVYALPVEQGAAPHFPPTGPIELWVKRKGILPMSVSGEEISVPALAFLIARKINIVGFKPIWMFADALQNSMASILKILRSANDRVVAELNT